MTRRALTQHDLDQLARPVDLTPDHEVPGVFSLHSLAVGLVVLFIIGSMVAL